MTEDPLDALLDSLEEAAASGRALVALLGDDEPRVLAALIALAKTCERPDACASLESGWCRSLEIVCARVSNHGELEWFCAKHRRDPSEEDANGMAMLALQRIAAQRSVEQ